MNTLYLKYAVEVERAGSITKAAEKLYMNQPHLSKTIRELEEILGSPIFKRTVKGMLPTKKGTEFLTYAKNILAQVDMIENLASESHRPQTTLNIVVPRASYISYAFTEFVKALPLDRALSINYRETNSLRAIRDVVNGDNDLGIVRFPMKYENYFIDFIQEKGLSFELVSRFEYLILFSREHPLAKEDVIDSSRLENYIEITHGDTNVPSLEKPKKFLDEKGGKREIAVYERGSQLELLGRIPSTYMWVSPMPKEVLSTFALIQRRNDMPKNYYKDLLIYRNGYRFTEEDMGFIAKLRNVVKEILFFQKQ
ncbi:MAG: LysR family transcriptional regulator [Synergistaceae bacterium]|nr:LysR family transcriptional regulator [Synergistaceae bacterium]